MQLIAGETGSGLAVPVAVKDSGQLLVASIGTIGSTVYNDPVRIGYQDVIRTSKNTILAGGAQINIDFAAVPTGQVWIITNLAAYFAGTVTGVNYRFTLSNGTNGFYLFDDAPATSQRVNTSRQGNWIFKAGEFLRIEVYSSHVNDQLIVYQTGYMFNLVAA